MIMRKIAVIAFAVALVAGMPASAAKVQPAPGYIPLTSIGYGFPGDTFTPVDDTHGIPMNCIQGCGSTGAASNQVQGATPAGSAPVGNPVPNGCVIAAATPPTNTAGNTAFSLCDQRGDFRVRLIGSTAAAPTDSATTVTFTNSSISNSETSNTPLGVAPFLWSGSAYFSQRGDATGGFVHAPPSTVTQGGGTIASSGGTAALTFTNTTDGEVINPSTGTLWASWGTPTVNGANSFPITSGSSYRPPSRVAGTLTLLSTAASQTYTFNKF
jgi:hypothetical protein